MRLKTPKSYFIIATVLQNTWTFDAGITFKRTLDENIHGNIQLVFKIFEGLALTRSKELGRTSDMFVNVKNDQGKSLGTSVN